MATATKAGEKVRRGWDLSCPLCGTAADSTTISVHLHDTSEFHCSECDEVFTVEEVRQRIEPWLAVLAWCDSAPEVWKYP